MTLESLGVLFITGEALKSDELTHHKEKIMNKPTYVPQVDMPSVMEFLNQRGDSKCPWCGQSDWDIITESDSKTSSPVLENPDTIEMHTNNESFNRAKLLISKSNKSPSVSMKLRCNNCGCELRFDYFYVLSQIERLAEKA